MKTIGVHYLGSLMSYTFMCDDNDVAEGQFYIVKTNGQFSVVKVDEVHEKPQLKGPYTYTWVVQRIDDTRYKELCLADHTDENPPIANGRL